VDCERSIDFSSHNGVDDRMAVIATEPLTSDEAWVAFVPGELKMFVDGKVQDGAALYAHSGRAGAGQKRGQGRGCAIC
jgi:glutamine amidotransferase